MFYVQVKDGAFVRYIVDSEPTQWDDNNFCFARNLSKEDAEQFGVYKLKIVTPPYFDPLTQKREQGTAVLVDGKWTQTYIVTDLNMDQKMFNIRTQRDMLLAETDWTQTADAPQSTKDKWAPYRQALRDIPQQSGFPDNIQWPEQP